MKLTLDDCDVNCLIYINPDKPDIVLWNSSSEPINIVSTQTIMYQEFRIHSARFKYVNMRYHMRKHTHWEVIFEIEGLLLLLLLLLFLLLLLLLLLLVLLVLWMSDIHYVETYGLFVIYFIFTLFSFPSVNC